MAVRRLISMINGLAVHKSVRGIRNDQGATTPVNQQPQNDDFLFRGTVTAAGQSGCQVSTPLGTVPASLATDEPLQVGQPVWVMRTDDGSFVVLGSVSGA